MPKSSKSEWRRRARKVIDSALADAKAQGLDGPATLKLIDSHRPSPPPSWPYQMWLKERRITIEALQLPTCHPRPAYTCKFCQDQGCLACAKPQPGGELPAVYYTGGPRDEQSAT